MRPDRSQTHDIVKLPNLAFYTRWIFVLARSPAARQLALSRLYQLENEDAAEQAMRPARLVYVEDHGDEVEVKLIDMPGVAIQESRRFLEVLPTGGTRELVDEPERRWTEVEQDGVEVPLGAGHILAWAQERSRRILRSDQALEVLGVAGLTMPVFFSALAGQGDLAMVQAHGAGLMMCIVQMVQLVRG